MLYKRYLKQWLFLFKAAKWTMLVPVIVAYVFVPLINYGIYRSNGVNQSLYITILIYTQTFLPYFSTWWSMMSLKDFVEGDGREILISGTKKLHIFFILNFILYALLLAVLYAVYISMYPIMILAYVIMLIECALFNAIVYLLMTGFKSLIVSISVPLIYTVYSFMNGLKDDSIRIVYLYIHDPTRDIISDKYIPMLIVSVCIIAAVSFLNKKLYRYV